MSKTRFIFGERLRVAREAAGLLQSELARTMECSQSAISNWEKGLRDMSIPDTTKACKILNTTPDFLFGFTDVIHPQSKRPLVQSGSELHQYIQRLNGMVINLRTKINQLEGTQS